jgi:hypothetical protein
MKRYKKIEYDQITRTMKKFGNAQKVKLIKKNIFPPFETLALICCLQRGATFRRAPKSALTKILGKIREKIKINVIRTSYRSTEIIKIPPKSLETFFFQAIPNRQEFFENRYSTRVFWRSRESLVTLLLAPTYRLYPHMVGRANGCAQRGVHGLLHVIAHIGAPRHSTRDVLNIDSS